MAIEKVNVSAKLSNGDAGTPTATDILLSVGMARSSNSGRVFSDPFHEVGTVTYDTGFFEENSPGSTFTYSFADFTRSPPTVSSTEDFTWSGAMVSSGDGDIVRYGLDGTHASNDLDGDAIEFTGTTTPSAITIVPEPEEGDFIYYFIAFNTGAIDTAPSGFDLDVTGEMANLSQGRWYSKISDGTETTVAATLTASATGTHCAGSVPAAADAGVSVNLTGNQSTFSVGAVDNQTDQALTGNQIAASVGSVDNQLNIDLSGNESTFALGDVSNSVSLAISGISNTITLGNVQNSTDVNLSGNLGTFALGNLSVDANVIVNLTGVASAISIESLGISRDSALTGNQLTQTINDLINETAVSISGNLVNQTLGSVTPSGDKTVFLTGIDLSIDLGTISVVDLVVGYLEGETLIFTAYNLETTVSQALDSETSITNALNGQTFISS